MSGCHSPYTIGNVAISQPSLGGYCQCPCHLSTWMGIYPPQCYCQCRIGVFKVTNTEPTILYIENKKMDDKIKKLEERLEEVEKWKKTAKILCDQSKKPHACPLCKGTGEGILMGIRNCIPCEGKGIVWG